MKNMNKTWAIIAIAILVVLGGVWMTTAGNVAETENQSAAAAGAPKPGTGGPVGPGGGGKPSEADQTVDPCAGAKIKALCQARQKVHDGVGWTKDKMGGLMGGAQCPEGYVCTPVEPPPACPEGYTCTPKKN